MIKIRNSTSQIGAVDADFCALAFDARAGELIDDASYPVHLSVNVAAIDL